MQLSYLLFTGYLLLLCWVIAVMPFTRTTGLAKKHIIVLFILKVAAGIFLGWMSQKYYPEGNDYWNLHRDGKIDYEILTNEPGKFFTDIFKSHYGHYGNFFGSANSYWNDLENNLVIKFLAIFNIFSRGDYYVNSLFFNFLGFFGHIALFHVFSDVYKNRKWAIIAGCFLIPSTLYFSSGIHKDNVVFTLLGFFCLAIYRINRLEFSKKRLALIVGTFIGLLLFRNYVAVCIVPAAIAFIISWKKAKPWATFIIVYSLSVAVVFTIPLISPANPLSIMSGRQQAYLDLPRAASQLPMDTLAPTAKGIISNTPSALNHAFLRPYPGEFSFFFTFLAIELYLLFALSVWAIILNRRMANVNAFIPFAIFLGLTIILFAGYIVPNAGALVRYRSLYLPLLATPIFASLWKAKQTY